MSASSRMLGIGPHDKGLRARLPRDRDRPSAAGGFRSFGCHFKSMNNGREDGRQITLPMRRAEALACDG